MKFKNFNINNEFVITEINIINEMLSPKSWGIQMANPDLPSDPKALKRELKRLAHEEKMKKKQAKRERKMKKKEKKKNRKEAVLRAKLAKRGIKVPMDSTSKQQAKTGEETPASGTITTPGTSIPEAEIITEADKWSPKSAKKLDEIQKMIDRMDHNSVKSLRDRYKERYGEDMEVPDVYENRPSIEVETAEQAGELEPISSTSISSGSDQTMLDTPAASKPKTSLFGSPLKSPKPKIDRPLRLLDYRTPMFLRDKFGTKGGKGIRAVLSIVDIILNILLGIVLIKVIMTIVYVMKDKKMEKQLRMMEQESSQPQPTS